MPERRAESPGHAGDTGTELAVGTPAFGRGVGDHAVAQRPAETEQEGGERPLAGRHTTLVLGMGGRLLGEQEAGSRYSGCSAHVEQATHILCIGDTARGKDRHVTGDVEHLGKRALDRLDAEQVTAGLNSLDDETARVHRERPAGLLGRADRDKYRESSLAQTRDPPARASPMKHHERRARLRTRVHVSLSDERHEQVRRHRTPRGATVCLAQSGGERSRGHHADRPQPPGGGHRARELAARNAAGHPGLYHRALDPDLVQEGVGARWPHAADATAWIVPRTMDATPRP